MNRGSKGVLAGVFGLVLFAAGMVSAPAEATPAVASMARVAAAPAAATMGLSAAFEMNEPAGTTVMLDSSGRNNHGQVDPAGVQSGYNVGGATGYNWVWRSPTAPPADPSRVIHVPDSNDLEPGDQAFTIELRYRTKEKFGNITQKGQATTAGGQWKIQNPGGMPSCLFKGSLGRVATRAPEPLNDLQWHTLTCTYDSTGVVMYVDGVYKSRKRGSAGVINNKMPMTVGGKTDCDQIRVTCDYFTGQIDYLRISKSGVSNAPPVAEFTHSCIELACTFDSSGSSDPDGSIVSRTWNFGDGQTSGAISPTHQYAAAGSYPVTLTVTDNQGATRVASRIVTVTTDSQPSAVTFETSASSSGGDRNPSVRVPAGAAAGQRMLLVLSLNSSDISVSDPGGLTGWTQVGEVDDGSMRTVAWTRVAQAGDAGTLVTTPLGAAAKHTVVLATYSGVAPGTPVVATGTTGSSTTHHQAPAVQAPVGAWVVTYWADKSSSTTSWASPGSVTDREVPCTAGGGRVCSLLSDSGEPVASGNYGPLTAQTNAPSNKATMLSVVLAAE